MSKYISLGKFKRSFQYLLYAIISQVINDTLYGYNHNESFKTAKIFNDDVQNSLSKHRILHNTFNYLGTSICAFALYRYEIKVDSKNSNKKPTKKDKKKTKIILIHYSGIKDFKTKKSFILFIIIIFLWIFEEQFINLFMLCLKDLDFWMIEILIISLICVKMFKIEIYKHQWLAIIFNIIPCSLKIVTIILSYYDNNKDKDEYLNNLPILYRVNSIYIPIGIITFLLLIIIRSFVNARLKCFMDFNYISINKLLIFYGLMGGVICSSILAITSNKECTINKGTNDKKIEIDDYICQVYKVINFTNHNMTSIYTYKYMDNFSVYRKTLKNIEILKELVIILLGIVTFFFNKFFTLMAIKYLTPTHIVFKTPIYFLFQKAVLILITLIWKHSFFVVSNNIKKYKFFLDICGDISSFFAFLIYLEIIILNFFGFNYNIDLNISERSLKESGGTTDSESNHSEKSLFDNNEEEFFNNDYIELAKP